LILGFHTKQLTERGTEVALFDYALAAREILGHEVRIYVPAGSRELPFVRRSFEEQFDVVRYTSPSHIACDALYVIKRGRPGRITDSIPELNHAFYDVSEPHGHRFAAMSKWLANSAAWRIPAPRGRTITIPKPKKPPVVPLIVTLPDLDDDLRDELGIPADAVVFGRHGGIGNFDIEFVLDAIRTAVGEREDIWFALLQVEPFFEHERVVYLSRLDDRAAIRRFVNSCDYMLHATSYGEGFGLSVAEFALVGAPVMTWLESPEKGHLELLSDDLLLGYRNYEDLLRYLRTLQRRTAPVFSDVAERYGVERVMARFDAVFLR
jgi:glycosyltransferase involved in cell wall biosynthesis